MINGDLSRRVLIKFDADQQQLVDALNEIESGTRVMTEQFGAAAANAHRAFDTIGLGANNQISKLQRFSNAFQGLTGKLGAGLGAIDSFAKSLGPWNQALGLASKAIDAVDAGLDAYGKSSKQAQAEVSALKKEFGGLKDAVLSTAGEMTVALLKPLNVLERMRQEIDNQTRDTSGSAGAAYFLSGKFIDDAKMRIGASDPWSTAGTTASVIWDKLEKKVNDARQKDEAAAKKAYDEAMLLRAEAVARAKLHDYSMDGGNAARTSSYATIGDVVVRTGDYKGSATAGSLGEKADYSDAGIGAAFKDTQLQNKANDLEASTRESRYAKHNESRLEQMFGPIDDFDAYTTAFDTLTTGVQSAMSAWISGSESLGTAIKKGIGTALAGLASQLAVEGLKHGAYALGSLAFGDYAGAARHAAAAAAFGAGAIAAAAAAKKLGGGGAAAPSASSGGASAGSGSSSSSSSGATGAKSNGAGQQTMIIVYGDNFANDSPRMRQLRAEQLVKQATGSAAAEHS